MTLHIHYRGQSLSGHWRPDGTLAVRLRPRRHHGEALLVHLGDSLVLTDTAGRARWICRVQAFHPHLQYGRFVRSGTVVCAETARVGGSGSI
jgi:hypothetical protein